MSIIYTHIRRGIFTAKPSATKKNLSISDRLIRIVTVTCIAGPYFFGVISGAPGIALLGLAGT